MAAPIRLTRTAMLLLSVLLAPAAIRAAPPNGPPAGAAADASSAASPVAADPQHGRVLYLQHCVACHGERAWGDGPREIPALAGQREAYLSVQLTRFASGDRAGSAMHGPAMHDTLRATDVNRAPAIRDLAAYLAAAPAAAEPERGEGTALDVGKSAYLRACAGCHGTNASGTEGAAPRIGAQHYRYLEARLREFVVVHRGALGESPLSAPEQAAVADYLSRLPPQ